MTDTELELPQGWELTTLSQVSKITSGFAFKSKDFVNGGIPVVKISNIGYGKFIKKNQEFLPISYLDKFEDFIVKPKIILMALTRPITNDILKICEYPGEHPPSLLNQRVAKIELLELFSRKILLYYFQSQNFKEQIIQNISGTEQPNISISKLAGFLFPLPPLNEQKRIVSKIEELFSKIDSAKQSLEHTKVQLEQYRELLLKSAFEGKLTEGWRENNVLEHSSGLLGKIVQDQTKTGRRIKKLVNFDSFKKYELPNNWIWTNILSITKDLGDSPFGSDLKSKDYVDDGIPVIHGRNIKNNEFEWSFPLYVTKKKFDSLKRSHCHPDDIIFQKIGSVGLIAILPKIESHESFLLSTNCMKICTNEKIIPKKFIFYYFIQAKIKEFILRNAQGTSQPIFNFTTLKSFPIPLPSTKEQEQIVSQIEQGFSLIENTTQIVNATLQKLQTMKMSILKKAFEGNLVPQDPEDEPASVLLEKIKAEKS